MAARDTVRRLVRSPARRVRRALFPEYEDLLRDRGVLFESVTAAHRGIADLQVAERALRERLDATLLLAESAPPRMEALQHEVDDLREALRDREALGNEVRELREGLLEARRLNLRIAELTDVVTEIVLPLHDRDIDAEKLNSLAADTY